MKKSQDVLIDISPTKYVDDEYLAIENEYDQIRTCLGMYISQANTEGALHLFKEIFHNALDESVNPHSPSRKVYVTFNEDKREFTITDEGRGIPFEKLSSIATKKHTSTKFVRTEPWMKYQAGRNGIGLVVTAALTDYMSLVSYRGKKSKTIEFRDGAMDEHPIENLKKSQNGLSIKLIPSEKYLGEINLEMFMVEDFLRRISYLLPPDIKVIYYGEPSDEKAFKREYEYEGLGANVEYISTTLEFPPIDVETESDEFDLMLSFSYDKTLDEMLVDSYCNYIYTKEGGTHEVAAQRAVCDFFTREARKLDPNAKYEVTYDDCKKGLIMAINCRHINPAFEGQHKSRVSNKDILSVGKGSLMAALYKYFNNNTALLRKIIVYLRQISKIRMEAHKIKGIPLKKHTTFLDDADLTLKFMNVSDRNSTKYKELLITEGDSSFNSMKTAVNKEYQALVAVQGVTDNVHGLTIAQVMSKPIFKSLLTILGCGIGKDFDINKLKYDKIVIVSDSDVDGSAITSYILCFFFFFLRELIDEGKVYKAIPPLYLIDTKSVNKYYKGKPWLFDKNDYYALLNTIISNNVDVGMDDPETGFSLFKKSTLQNWLVFNDEYLLLLDNLVKKTACKSIILEYICYYKIISLGDEDKFKKLIEDKFPELIYDEYDKNLSGSLNSEYVSIICDNLFMKSAKDFIKILSENPAFFIYCKNKNDDKDKFDKMSIGEFLRMMNKSFNIKILERYKGLGEASSHILFSTTLNPKTRKLMRMNISDVEEATKMFDLWHSKSADMRELRGEILDNLSISYSDIDN